MCQNDGVVRIKATTGLLPDLFKVKTQLNPRLLIILAPVAKEGSTRRPAGVFRSALEHVKAISVCRRLISS